MVLVQRVLHARADKHDSALQEQQMPYDEFGLDVAIATMFSRHSLPLNHEYILSPSEQWQLRGGDKQLLLLVTTKAPVSADTVDPFTFR